MEPLPQPAPAGRGRARGRGRGRGRARGGGGDNEGGDAPPHPPPPPQVSTVSTFLSNLVRLTGGGVRVGASIKTKVILGMLRHIAASTRRCSNQLKSEQTWKAILDAVPVFLDQRLCFCYEPLGEEHHANFRSNKETLEFLGHLQKAEDVEVHNGEQAMQSKSGFAHHEAASELLQMVGYGNWSGASVKVFFSAEFDFHKTQQFKGSLVKRLTNLIKAVFLNERPPTPCQSRWTGVCGVARFAYGLCSFRNLFKSAFGSLAPTPSGKGKGKGKARDGDQVHAADLDVT